MFDIAVVISLKYNLYTTLVLFYNPTEMKYKY